MAASFGSVHVGERLQLALDELHAVHFLKQLIMFCAICSAIIIFKKKWYLTPVVIIWCVIFEVVQWPIISESFCAKLSVTATQARVTGGRFLKLLMVLSVWHQQEAGRWVILSSREQVRRKEGSRANKSLGRSFWDDKHVLLPEGNH